MDFERLENFWQMYLVEKFDGYVHSYHRRLFYHLQRPNKWHSNTWRESIWVSYAIFLHGCEFATTPAALAKFL